MTQNQTTDNDALQNAIDEIANATNKEIMGATNKDIVFSDPVAAPSSVPEGDTGELGDSVGPFPDLNPQFTSTPDQTTPDMPESLNAFSSSEPTLTPTSQTDYSTMNPQFSSTTFPSTPMPPINPPLQEQPSSPTDFPTPQAPTSSPEDTSAPDLSITPPEPESQIADDALSPKAISTTTENSDIAQIKAAALRELAPYINKLPDLDAEEKFRLYQDVIEDLNDRAALPQAYEAARNIVDETSRAKALLYIINAIDKS